MAKRMTSQETTNHMLEHYRRSLQELKDDDLIPDMHGLVAFAQSINMSLIGQRAELAAMGWVHVLQADCNSMLQLGHDLFGCPHGGEHGPHDHDGSA